jgi:hypothetical protein
MTWGYLGVDNGEFAALLQLLWTALIVAGPVALVVTGPINVSKDKKVLSGGSRTSTQ